MRFYSHWIHVIWLYRLVNIYYPFASETRNTITLLLYGIVGGCDYANRMYPIWHKRLHAVNENPNVADRFSLFEFAITFLASIVSAYWMLDNLIPPWAWGILLITSWIGHIILRKLWQKHLSRLTQATYRHVPGV